MRPTKKLTGTVETLPVVLVAANQEWAQKSGTEQQKPHQNMMAAMKAIMFTLHHKPEFDCHEKA